MKKQLLFISLFGAGIAISQQNLSFNTVSGTLPAGQEIFRFLPGYASQIQAGSGFGFASTNRWFSLGEVTSGSQTFYGSRFQYNERALVMGYSDAAANTPRIQWIHNGGSTAGNLEFRVASSFTSTSSDLVASMTPQANTYFGNANPAIFSSYNPKVGIGFDVQTGLQISTFGTLSSSINPTGAVIEVSHNGNTGTGLLADCLGGQSSTGVFGRGNGQQSSIGVFGGSPSTTQFGAAIYGDPSGTGGNLFAGYFNGDVFATGAYLPSDMKLKENMAFESKVLDRISMLKPVTYNYKSIEGINLPRVNQHGFISQEMAEVFPELTKDITQPVFDENGKIISELSFKAINYVGLISVLTAGIQELNTELAVVRQELEDYKANDNVRSQLLQNNNAVKGYSMEQNTPNPFSDRSSIRYQLAPGVEQATISIFNLNGGFVRDYVLEGNAGEITILASEIGKGMFIYSLTQNGQEILSKRMIVK